MKSKSPAIPSLNVPNNREAKPGSMRTKTWFKATVLASAITTALAASGATYNWNTSASSSTWNTTDTTIWQEGIAWANDTTTPNAAILGGAGRTITLGEPITAGSVTFTNGLGTVRYRISGSTLTLAGTTPTINAATNATIASTLAGTDGFTKGGVGRLALSGINSSLSGPVLINAGPAVAASGLGFNAAVIASNVNAFGTGPIAIGAVPNLRAIEFSLTGGATVANAINLPTDPAAVQVGIQGYNSSTSYGLSGKISGGSPGLVFFIDMGNVQSAGITRLSNADNDFKAGTIHVNRGVLAVTSDSVLGDPANVVKTYQSGTAGALRFDAPNINIARQMMMSAGCGLDVRGDNNGDGTVETSNDATISGNMDGTAVTSVPWTVRGGSQTNGTSTGSLRLTGNNTFDGAIIVYADTKLIAGSSTALGADYSWSSTAVTNGGTLALDNVDSYANLERLTLYGAGCRSGGVGMGALQNLAGDNTFNGSITLGADAAVGVAAGSLTLGGEIAGSYRLTKVGTGTLTLTGANTYTGDTIVSNGVLALSGSGTIDSSTQLNLAAGGTFDVSTLGSDYTPGWGSLCASGTGTAPATIKGASGFSVNLNWQPINLTYDGSNPALSISQGTLSLNNNAFTINAASALLPGTYTLIRQANGNIGASGTFSAAGTAIGSPASISVVGGEVRLTVAGLPAPSFTPAAGGYIGAIQVTITPPSGAMAYYTTNNWATTNLYSGPITLLPPQSGLTIQAFGRIDGYPDGVVGSATYTSVTTPTWVATSGGNWSDTSNWSNLVVAAGTDVMADFSKVALGDDCQVSLDGAYTIGHMTFDDRSATKHNWGLVPTTGNPLTLAVSNGSPTITVAGGVTNTISAGLAGTNGMTKAGIGTVTLTGSNAYTGTFVASAGTTVFGVGGSLMNASGIIISNGASVQFSGTPETNPLGTNNMPILIMPGGTLAVANSPNCMGWYRWGMASITDYGAVTLFVEQYANTLSLNGGTVSGQGPLRFYVLYNGNDTAISCTNTGTIACPLMASTHRYVDVAANSTLNLSSNWSGAWTKLGAGQIILTGIYDDPANTITISQGTLQVGDGGTAGALSAPGAGAANIANNATLAFNRSDAIEVGNLITGSGTLIQSGSGMLTLTNVKTYTGSILINKGVLALKSSDALDNSTQLNIAAGGTFDVSALASDYSPRWGSLAVGGTGTAPATITADADSMFNLIYLQPITMTYDGSNPALSISQGTLRLNNNAFTINAASPLAPGTYTLIRQATGNISAVGTFSVTGTAIGGPASISVVGGEVKLTISAALTPPTLSGCGPLSAGSFPLTFNGPSGQGYHVLCSSNVALPIAQWGILTSGTFAGSPVTYTDSSATNSPRFYRVVSP